MSITSTITVPVQLNFERNKQIGTLTIDPAALPKDPSFIFSLGVECLKPYPKDCSGPPKSQYIGPYNLVSVGLVSQQNYVRYLEQVGVLPVSNWQHLPDRISQISDQVQVQIGHRVDSVRHGFDLVSDLKAVITGSLARYVPLTLVLSLKAHTELMGFTDYTDMLETAASHQNALDGSTDIFMGMSVIVDRRQNQPSFISVAAVDHVISVSAVDHIIRGAYPVVTSYATVVCDSESVEVAQQDSPTPTVATVQHGLDSVAQGERLSAPTDFVRPVRPRGSSKEILYVDDAPGSCIEVSLESVQARAQLNAFPLDELDDLAEALLAGYDPTVEISSTDSSPNRVESTTAEAARFIRAYVAHQRSATL